MITNGYSGLAAFAAILQIALGVVVVWFGIRALRQRAASNPCVADEADAESSYYFRFVVGLTLCGVVIAAWPLFYLVLQSYVGQWPGVMCIDGVVRIGASSANSASHLPGLVAFMEISKPALVFLAGSWLVVHLLMQSQRGGRLQRVSVATMLTFGLLGVLDGAAEGAYLVIPKQEQALATGCCTVDSQESVFANAGPREPSGRGPLTVAFVAACAWVAFWVTASIRRIRMSQAAGYRLALAAVGAAALIPLGAIYLREVAAPLFLQLPYHQCAYCLVGVAPEALVAVGLFSLATFAVGWAVIARGLDRSNQAIALPLLRFARFGFLATLLMLGVRMATA